MKQHIPALDHASFQPLEEAAPACRVSGRHLWNDFETTGIWLDSAYQHPMSRSTRAAVAAYLDQRVGMERHSDSGEVSRAVLAQFADTIGADPGKVCFVPGATTAENLLIVALGLRHGARIVTDALHFSGSLYLYRRLRDLGFAVTVVAAREGRIEPADLDHALGEGADLLALSWVSAFNGFRHDLRSIATMAHRHGVPVYADLTQGVGAIPLDVRETGVDFCATSSYKWLMAEIGLGFLHVAPGSLSLLQPPQFGARQLAEDARETLRDEVRPGPAGLFEVASTSNIVKAALERSLADILDVGVAELAAHRAPLLAHAREEMARLGLTALSPPDSGGPLVAYRCPDGAALRPALAQAGVYVTCYADRFRIAPSIFNTHADIEALARTLHGRAS